MLNSYNDYAFRPITPDDAPFVRHLYGVTLRSQMPFEEAGLDHDQIEQLLNHQLAAQTLHYSSNYPEAEISIIEREGEPVGRLIIIHFEHELRLGDLMILPEHQNRGICSYIMNEYVAEGLASGRVIRLHVEKFNRAVELYTRQQFVVIEDLASHWLMEYRPGEAAPQVAEPLSSDQLNTAS